MSHKLDKKRHRRNVRNNRRSIKAAYLKLTAGDTVAPEKALSVLKDNETVARARNLARRLAARGVYVRLLAER